MYAMTQKSLETTIRGSFGAGSNARSDAAADSFVTNNRSIIICPSIQPRGQPK